MNNNRLEDSAMTVEGIIMAEPSATVAAGVAGWKAGIGGALAALLVSHGDIIGCAAAGAWLSLANRPAGRRLDAALYLIAVTGLASALAGAGGWVLTDHTGLPAVYAPRVAAALIAALADRILAAIGARIDNTTPSAK